MSTEISKKRKTIGMVMAGLLTAFLLFTALGKLTMPAMAENFQKWGLGDWRIIIAAGEIVSVLLFLIPRTGIVGTLLLSSYFGGAIMVHMIHGESFLVPAAVLVYVWITAFIRYPELSERLRG
ncbi:DoxX family protein [Thermonema rossianum]|jgi:hypothetical protein|uniref:DoxX family protein n=1 Tax=Thermonema rossianum TaxID=55505 RepID=UPI00056FF5E0|nr:DoxX family protein [Thermonema rossianum]